MNTLMKLSILLFAAAALNLTRANAQSGWASQWSGPAYDFLAVDFVGVSTGTAVGFGGIIVHTTDGGKTWTSQSSGVAKTLSGVSFTDVNTGTAAGEDGTVIRTTNGGATWTLRSIGTTTKDFFDVFFTDANNGTAVGWDSLALGIIYRTTNGGTSWLNQTSGPLHYLVGVWFTDVNNGWTVGHYGIILRTTNGGTTWTSQTSGTTENLTKVQFVNANTGFVTGEHGTVLRTTNAGATWVGQSSGVTNTLGGISFTDASTGTVVGFGGIILRTTNGGAIWTIQSSGTTKDLYGVSFSDPNAGTAVGSGGTILGTMIGGTTCGWLRQTSGTTRRLTSVWFTDANTGTAVGYSGTLLRTTNGGATWVSQPSDTLRTLHDVCFSDANNGFIVGNYDTTGLILRTTNGGASWGLQTSQGGNYYTGVFFATQSIGTVVGGTILRTTNGGGNWTPQTGAGYLYAVHMSSPDIATAVGSGGIIIRTTNGGATWVAQTSHTNRDLMGVWFTDSNHGIAVGVDATIQFTNDGGAYWHIWNRPVFRHFHDVSFSGSNAGAIVGGVGAIIRTTNGGITWGAQSSGTNAYLYGVSQIDSNTVVAVGDSGMILRTTTGGEVPALRFAPTEITFPDTILPGGSTQFPLVVANDGGYALAVSRLSSVDTVFTVSQTRFLVNAHSSVVVDVSFKPPSNGTHHGKLVIFTNDPAHPVDTVHCQGTAGVALAPLAYFPFTGNANDSSGHGHHGIPVNNPSLSKDRFGHDASAYDLDGLNQYIELPGSIIISADLSISFWVRTTQADPENWPAARFIIDRDICGGAPDWSVGLGGGARIQFATGTGSSPDEVLTGSENVNDSTWKHVVVVRDSVSAKKLVYLNDALDVSATFWDVPFINNTIPILVGASACDPAIHKFFRGGIDDIRLYSRALSEAEVRSLFHEGGWATGRILSTSPPMHRLNVRADTTISATFDASLTGASTTDSTFLVRGNLSGRHAGTISYNSASRAATFAPAKSFAAGEVVTVTLTSGIRLIDGTPLRSPYCWQFTVAATGGSGRFVLDSSYASGPTPYSPVAADLDGDGDMDVAVANQAEGNVSVLLNDGSGKFSARTPYAIGTPCEAVVAGDVNGDGAIDLVASNSTTTGAVVILLNDGHGAFPMRDSVSPPGYNTGSVCLSDVDRDGNLDLIVSKDVPGTLSVFLNNSYGHFTFNASYTLGNGASIVAGDWDNDGDPDIAGGIWPANALYTLPNKGDSTFGSFATYPVGVGPAYVRTADLNGDGYLDLCATNHYEHSASVLLNKGDGTFATHVTYDAGVAPYIVIPADVDNDGDQDLIVQNREDDDVSVLLNHGDGTFETQKRYATGDGPVGLVGADFDGDGDLDLITTNVNSGDISVLFNDNATGVAASSGDLPTVFALGLNYPNPFNPVTRIRYQLPEASVVRLVVYDILGREVALLVNERKAPGFYEVEFDARGVASGVYLYRLTAGSPSTGSGSRAKSSGFVQTRKMVVLK